MSNAGNVTIVLSADKVGYSAALDQAGRELDKLKGKSQSFGHGTVSGMQAASASIRLLENPLGNNMRAIERLISQSKVLSSVMKAAFPLVGAIAIAGMFTKLGTEVIKFIDEVNKMPKAIAQGFDALNLSLRSSNDQLDLTNARLSSEIAKLEGKPQNNLKTALAESRVEADKLATSLSNDSKAVNDLLSQNKIGFLGQLLGKASTSNVSGSIQSYMNDLQVLGNQLSVAVSKGDSKGADSIRQQINAKQDSGLGWAKSKLFVTDNPNLAGPDDQVMGGDQASNRAELLGFQGVLLGQQHRQSSEDTNKTLTGIKEKDEAAKAATESAKAAARAALEAQKKAAAEQLAAWEESNSDWKAAQDRSLLDDADWWKAKLATLSTGALNYRAVSKKMNADIIADNREMAEARPTWANDFLKDGNANGGISKDDAAQVTATGKATADWIASLRSGVELEKQNATAIAESSLQMAVATGRMTRLDASQVQANLHTQEYNERLQELKDNRDSITNNSSLSDIQRKAQLAASDNQIASLNNQRGLQVQQDNASTNPQDSLASVGFVDALNDFVLASKDAAGQMREITTGTLNTLNGEFIKAISGQKTDFGNAGASIFRNIAGIGLQKAEGSIMSGLGFGGKADGSKGNPLYVRIADAVTGGVGSAGKGLAKLFGGGDGDDEEGSSGGSSKSGGGWLTSLVGMIPGFAGGGVVTPGTLAMVGENGPELAYFGSGAHITPNHKLSNIGSVGGDTHNWNIDARGTNDPAQVRYQVQQGIMQAAPHLTAQSMQAKAQQNRRSPSTRQK